MIELEEYWKDVRELSCGIIQLINQYSQEIPSSLGSQLRGIQSHYESEISGTCDPHAKRKHLVRYKRALSSLFWKIYKIVFGTDAREGREVSF